MAPHGDTPFEARTPLNRGVVGGHVHTAARWTVVLDGPCRYESGQLVVEQDGHRWDVQCSGLVYHDEWATALDLESAATRLGAGMQLELVRTGLGIQLVAVTAA